MRRMVFFAAAGLLAAALGQPALADCKLGNGIEHIVFIQFDNVHLRRDIPNVPSDLEQIPNLRISSRMMARSSRTTTRR